MEQLFEETGLSSVKPIRDIVYERLRKAILEGKIKPGERIIEKEYADKLNISRTPVREALRKLEIEGFVKHIPRKGVVVKGFSFKDIIEIYEIRKSLESLAVKHAIQNITDEEVEKLKTLVEKAEEAEKMRKFEEVFEIANEFHQNILITSSMPRLKNMINTLQEYLERFRRVTMSKDSRRLSALKEHRDILNAIIDRDVQKAEELVHKHIESSKKVFFEEFKVDLK